MTIIIRKKVVRYVDAELDVDAIRAEIPREGEHVNFLDFLDSGTDVIHPCTNPARIAADAITVTAVTRSSHDFCGQVDFMFQDVAYQYQAYMQYEDYDQRIVRCDSPFEDISGDEMSGLFSTVPALGLTEPTLFGDIQWFGDALLAATLDDPRDEEASDAP